MDNELINILVKFEKHGVNASYHYADDSCKEWHLGDKEKAAAMELFNTNPDLQDQMREIAKGFLWKLNKG